MFRRVLPFLLLVFGLLAPAIASAARPPAATLADPRISWVRVGTITPAAGEPTGQSGRVVVRVRVQHAPLANPAPGVRSVGSMTVVLSRFQGDRDYTIGGGTAARALPILSDGIGVVYRVLLNPRQSAAVVAASRGGTLRALVLVDQRATAKGRGPAIGNALSLAPATAFTVGAQLPADAPPLLERARTQVVIGADKDGRSLIARVRIPLSGGRVLDLGPGAAVDSTGAPTALSGTLRVLGADGALLGEAPAPAGFTLAVRPTGNQAGTLIWPALEVPGVEPIPAGRAVLRPPSPKR